MATTVVSERVERVAATCAAPSPGRAALTGALDDVARLESWVAARRAELVTKLAERPGAFPEADVAASTGCSLGAATKETDRATTLGAAESFATALDAGEIRPGHVDALTRATKRLGEEQVASLLGQQEHLVDRAAGSSIRGFEDLLRRKVKELQSAADAEARLARQRRATRLRHWVDPDDGMWCLSGRFDPETGRRLARALDDATRSMFAEATPDTAPSDRRERQQHLDALALARLVSGEASPRSVPGAPEVVVDATTATPMDGPSAGPALDWGIPVELPWSVLQEIFEVADPSVVIVANGVVLHAPGRLDLGRTTRLANRAQRRALRGLYSTCAVPGCAVHVDRCRLHHVVWWRHGGRTDLDNLLPVCTHHHTRLHADGWRVTLGPNRELTIVLADGRVMSTGPPNRSAA